MKIKYTNDGGRISKFLSIVIKTLGIFFLCFYNFYSGKDSSDENMTHVNDSAQIITENNIENAEKAKIYITAGATISEFSENNFEIVQVKYAKKHIASKSKATVKHKHLKAEADPAKQNAARTLPKKKETFSSGSESDVAFSSHRQFNSVVVQTQNYVLKHFVKTCFINFQIPFSSSSETKTQVCLTQFIGEIYPNSFSVRPPPAKA